MGRLFILGIVILVFLWTQSSFSQTVNTEVQTVSPQGQQQGEQFINPPYFPQKDLDVFEMSTLGNSGLKQRKTESTLTSPTKRKSNLEVNKPREKKGSEKDFMEIEVGSIGESRGEEVGESSEEVTYSSLSGGGKLYRWVDDKGILHVTNDLGSVPAKYRDKILNK
ncbi:MAG: hypothetical protein KatS3mg078_0876 [Deltaproteobacteria bacterium]|jgi:hypothetical protein|nr:MAG: hypothetical protein KatS3mg078_0876 [Deltaproteobacteria bacterium]